MKILIIHPFDPLGNKIGGMQTFLRNFAKYALLDFEIYIVGVTTDTIKRPIGKWQIIQCQGKTVNFLPVLYVVDENKKSAVPLTFKFVCALLRFKNKISFKDHILDFHRVESVLPFLFNSNKKILFIHGHPKDYKNPGAEVKWKRIVGLYFLLERVIFKKVDKIYFVREDAAKDYREKYPLLAEKISFLPTWADDEVFYPFDQEKKKEIDRGFREKYGLDLDEKLILFVGRFEGAKDPLLLIETFQKILAKQPNSTLLLIGSGGLKDKMVEFAQKYGILEKIIFLGILGHQEIAKIMNICDVFLLTSCFEGMPRSAVEAVASGLPVVTFDVGEVKRVVKEGVSGRVVAGRSPQLLSQAVLDVLSNPRYNHKSAVRDCVSDYFASNILEEVYTVFRHLSKNE